MAYWWHCFFSVKKILLLARAYKWGLSVQSDTVEAPAGLNTRQLRPLVIDEDNAAARLINERLRYTFLRICSQDTT